jgi:LacI family transcriptional regulator
VSTLKDVARLAGVGVATASRVLSGHGAVSVDAVARVRAAVSTLDYRPSAIARALSLQRSGAIGIYMPFFRGSFYANLLARVDEQLRAVERHLVVANGCGLGNERQQALDGIEFLLSRDCDGLIVVSNELHDADLVRLLRRFDRSVLINRSVAGFEQQCFDIDHERGGRLAARVLLSRGHRDIATISGPHKAGDNEARMHGFRDELAAHGVTVAPAHAVDGDFTFDGGARAARALLPAGPQSPASLRKHLGYTAVFCANDAMATALISTFAQVGLRVPRDVSVVGYDDAEYAPYTSPPLTTVQVPIEPVAANACRFLLNQCYGMALPLEGDCMPHVVWRQSVDNGPHATLALDISPAV